MGVTRARDPRWFALARNRRPIAPTSQSPGDGAFSFPCVAREREEATWFLGRGMHDVVASRDNDYETSGSRSSCIAASITRTISLR